jgi:CRISPR-associated protein (TIGR03984 family)
MTARLRIYRKTGQTLPEALQSCATALTADGGAVALLYAPRWCRFAKFGADGVLRGPDGQPQPLATVFEARVFGPQAELRWLNDPAGRHRVVLLAESEQALAGFETDEVKHLGEPLPQTYLLWGEGTGTEGAAGWSRLATARIGPLDVPLPGVRHRQRVVLRSVEYLVSEEQHHGNTVVAEERLVGLAVEEASNG